MVAGPEPDAPCTRAAALARARANEIAKIERFISRSPVRGCVFEVREDVRRGQPPIRGRRSVTASWIDVQRGAEVEPESGGRGRGGRLRSPARFRHRRDVAAGFTIGAARAPGARPRALTDRHALPWPRARDRQRRAAVRSREDEVDMCRHLSCTSCIRKGLPPRHTRTLVVASPGLVYFPPSRLPI